MVVGDLARVGDSSDSCWGSLLGDGGPEFGKQKSPITGSSCDPPATMVSSGLSGGDGVVSRVMSSADEVLVAGGMTVVHIGPAFAQLRSRSGVGPAFAQLRSRSGGSSPAVDPGFGDCMPGAI